MLSLFPPPEESSVYLAAFLWIGLGPPFQKLTAEWRRLANGIGLGLPLPAIRREVPFQLTLQNGCENYLETFCPAVIAPFSLQSFQSCIFFSLSVLFPVELGTVLTRVVVDIDHVSPFRNSRETSWRGISFPPRGNPRRIYRTVATGRDHPFSAILTASSFIRAL